MIGDKVVVMLHYDASWWKTEAQIVEIEDEDFYRVMRADGQELYTHKANLKF